MCADESLHQKIAEAACHFIEQRRLRCFIAPRNITEIDWADNLYAAMEIIIKNLARYIADREE